MIQASEFAGTSSSWGIAFSLFSQTNSNHNTYKLRVLCIDREIGIKEFFHLSKDKKLNYWVKAPLHGDKSKNICYISSAIKAANKPGNSAFITGFLGSMLTGGNKIEENDKSRSLASAMQNNSKAINCTKDNFNRVIQMFTFKGLISGEYLNWVNCKDEAMVPNTEHPEYAQWQNDCIVYSLFNTSSQQSSLRSIEYNNKLWDIYNEFFWLSRSKMLQLAEQYNNMAVYDDVMSHGKAERFVYEKLKTVTLSEDAQAVLDAATALLIKTFPFRAEFAEKHPEYHINTWDAGWYQIKAIAKEYCKEDLVKFNELYTQFSDRLRPLVYELGFLYK